MEQTAHTPHLVLQEREQTLTPPLSRHREKEGRQPLPERVGIGRQGAGAVGGHGEQPR